MLHDRELLEKLSAFPAEKYDGEVFRATRLGLHPLTASVSGGRWMPTNVTPTLYTSAGRNGAIAEITFHWSQLTPRPSKHALLHRIALKTKKSIRLLRADLTAVGVDLSHYSDVNYAKTQAIGAAIAHLECDGLIVPSARWNCENVIVFMNNSDGDDDIALILNSEDLDWLAWARTHSRLP